MEECDSTWGSDSESDEPAAEDDSGISDSVSPAESDRVAGDSSPQVQWGVASVAQGPGRGAVTRHQQRTVLTRPGRGKGS